jgi:hypothetical protein
VLFAFLVTTFIANNPGITAAFIGLLITGLITLVASYWAMIASRLKSLEATDSKLEERVHEVETTLGKYEEHVGAGDKMFAQLMARVERHMTEEEDQVWGGMRELGNKLSMIHEDNLKAHTAIVERLAKVETKLPNGELQEVLEIVRGLRGR